MCRRWRRPSGGRDEALALLPDEAAIHHTLGLVYARQQRWEEASTELSLAVEAAPENAWFAFVYGIALNSAGRSAEAAELLRASLDRTPWDRDLLMGLSTIHRDRGQLGAALEYARRLGGGLARGCGCPSPAFRAGVQLMADNRLPPDALRRVQRRVQRFTPLVASLLVVLALLAARPAGAVGQELTRS